MVRSLDTLCEEVTGHTGVITTLEWPAIAVFKPDFGTFPEGGLDR
jgi:hypothetical protein